MEEDKIIRVGSRKSELALIQTKYVIGQLQTLFPERKFEIHTMSTVGDRVLNISLPKIGEKSLFTKDLEDALRTGRVDFVVHSLKDLPTTLPDGMAIGAVLEREDPRDALVLNERHRGKTLKTLPEGSVIGTSSLRRAAQLARFYPQLTVCDIRGNLNTRLAKLDADGSKFSGIILAHAGLVRMGWEKRISQVLKCDELLYAVGQGALAVECRADANDILGMLEKLCCRTTEGRIVAERSFLRTLGGGCSAPVAVSSSLKSARDTQKLSLRGAVWSLDGKTELRDEVACEIPLAPSEDDDEVPLKKAKVTRHSPDIIDDSKATGDAKNLDIGALITLHGDAFKRCPYSKQQQPHERCPLSIPIGQDVMGECPFFDTTQKVNLAEEFGPEGSCPHATTPPPPIEKCPFLVNQVKLIDCDAEQREHKGDISLPADANIPLFCGLFRHLSRTEDFLAKSEALGKQLADALIAKGAIEVMSKAQEEIRGKA
uniref:hydroxymethylbilane synthase n=1 Tax=Nyssomyia neivai TaxID=330878 RepID=A0A1L8DZL6_9DIPT